MSDGNSEPEVLVERRGPGGRLGVLVLNRPRAINALTLGMGRTLTQQLTDWADDPSIEAIVLTGAGDRGLCAGGDIVSIYWDAREGGRESEDFWREEYDLNALIDDLPKPYVALMDGIVLGGGVGVSAHGSHRVVTERTRVGLPEVSIGFVPDVGSTWMLSHAPGELGTFCALTAAHLDAGDAIEVGLADHFVESTDLPRLLELLETAEVEAALEQVAKPQPPSRLAGQRDWIDQVFAGDDVAAILDRLGEVEEPGADKALTAMRRNSPTSLAVALRALRSAARMSGLREALDQEYVIAVHMLRGHDFPEGIRAAVIDKDRTPHWNPPTIAEVTPELVDTHFAPLEESR